MGNNIKLMELLPEVAIAVTLYYTVSILIIIKNGIYQIKAVYWLVLLQIKKNIKKLQIVHMQLIGIAWVYMYHMIINTLIDFLLL